MKKIRIRALSLITLFALLVTMLPTGFAVSAAYETKIQIENANELGIKKDLIIGNGYRINKADYWTMIHTADSMKAVYCLEAGAHVSSGDSYTEDSANKYLESLATAELDADDIRNLIGRVFLYAFTGELTSVEAYYKYTATQLLVWEALVGQRDINFNRVDNGYTSVEKLLDNFQSDYAAQIVSGYYYEYEADIKEHSKSISFAKSTTSSAKKNAVQANSDGTYTFTDKNNVLSDFDAAVTDGSVISKSGNALKIKADSGKTAVVTLTQNNVKESGELTGFLTLTSDSKQTLAELKADPRKYYAAVKGVENGTLEIIKTSEDGIVADIEFIVLGNGKTYKVKTDRNGKINIPDLAAGEYTVTEVVPARYEKQQTKKVTVSAGKTASVSFSNTLKTGAIKINKQSEDGENGGRTFTISGGGKTYTVTTNGEGTAVLSDIPVYDKDNKKIAYTISEKNVPVKYVVPADQTATLTADSTASKTFKNALKKFTAEVIKKDSENGDPQGNASLAGAVYGLYRDGELINTYTTDEKGYFKTREYVCGNYTIQEISPSEGYRLDPTVYSIGAEAENYTIESNLISVNVTEDVIKGKISIIKHSDDGTTQIETPEAGAEFEVYLKSSGSYESAKDSEKDYLVCDENDFAATKTLLYGTYTVHQTKGWENTEWIEDFDVIISENEKEYFYLINDAVLTSYVRIVKKDAETGNLIPVSGIGFKVWDCKNSRYVEQKINYPSEMILDVFYTDESGTLTLPNELVYGDYKLHEVQTAEGYFLGSEAVPFTVDGKEEVITVEKFNVPQKGRISVQKTGNTFVSAAVSSSAYTDENGNVIESPVTYTPVFSESGLANAVFQIIAGEDIITADGTVRANAGDIVAEIATDENGYAETDPLYLGKYEIKEIQAPDGYVLNGESQFIELTYAGQEVEIRDTVNAEFFNEYQGVEITLSKLMEQDELFNIGNSDEYTNVRFGLFAAEDLTAADGTVIPADGLISEISLDENMTAKFDVQLPFGKYYVQEIGTDEHYVLNGEKYLVTFEYQGQDIQTVSIDCGTFENRLKRGKIEGIKTNESGGPLENALFGLFAMDCTEFTEENALMTAKSDDKGCFSFADIPFGEYVIRELSAPDGYILSDESYPVTISENDEIIRIEIENKPVTVEISKRDADGNELKGAQMQLLNSNGKVIEQWVSDGTNHIVAKLSAGKYILKETAAPEGYILATDICFEVLNDGTVTVDGAETTAVSENGNPLIVMIDEAEQKEMPQDTPHTGDSRSNTAAWLMIAGGLSGLCAMLVSCKIRKRKELERIRTEEIRKASECPDFIDKD
ncbi:MAG: SpaA isopeptide-forming pilin-related protein [Oscillospiraceae bacterium]